MKKKFVRLNAMIELLKHHNGASVRELAEHFQVSEMTIRRDLFELKKQNIVTNQYGAFFYRDMPAALPGMADDKYALPIASASHIKEKQRIGAYAASLVSDGDILIIDTGSTTDALACALSHGIKATVLCYNRNILNHLCLNPDISLIFAGGYYHSNTELFESPEGLSLISHTRANKVFVSAAGIHETLGVTCANSYETATKQAILKAGVEKILLADSSKFSVVRSSYFAGLADFDRIITDDGISSEWTARLKEINIPLHIV